ncbi:MAG TPA: polysaccharide biosynthesis tyrosine autokinase [Candidatus Hydrogenedentes bacterium]|nr:polysaccharide biosynthesis tyrosine autokinase [Candidatus Hydrogenedentota bacterium]
MASDTAALEQAANQAGTRENQFRFVLNVALRRWKLILLFSIVASVVYGVYGLYAFKLRPQYQGIADLVVRQSVWDRELLRDVGGKPLFESSPKALVDRVSRRGVAEDLTRALIQQDVAEGRAYASVVTEDEFSAKVAELESLLSIEPDPENGMIRISAHANSEESAKRIAEFGARVFIDRNRRFLSEEEEETHRFVVKKLDEMRAELDRADNELWQFRKNMGFRTKEQVTEEMQKMTQEVLNTEATQEEIKAKMQNIEEQLRAKNESLPLSIGQIPDTVIASLLEELNKLHTQRIQLSVVWQPNQGPLADLQAEIEDKEQAILQAMKEVDSGSGDGRNVLEDRRSLREQYLGLQLQLTSMDIQSATNRKLISELEAMLPDLAEKDKEYQNLLRKTDQLRNQLNGLLDREFQIATGLSREQGYIERQGATVASELPSARQVKPWFSFVIGGFIGLVVGFILAVMFELSDTSIRNIEDVSEYIGLDVIGTIPQMRFGRARGKYRGDYVPLTDGSEVDACIVTQNYPKSPISEAYRTLRTNLQLSTLHIKPKSIMVTSAVPGEGKTTTAVNMAVTFADSGMRVLIVDTDLRRPHVHHVLKTDRGPGLADVLREGYDVHSVIRPTRVDNLWIISSGRVPPNPSELIGSDRMRKLMTQLESEFDLVICDAPSMLVVTDPVLLATEVDTCVLVLSVKYARRETVIRGKKLLDSARANLAGVVLNGLEASRRNYYYYYYYYDESDSRRKKRWFHF